MSDTRSHGWDNASTDTVEALPLCEYHEATTGRLCTQNANLIARQAPCCIALAENRHI